MNDGRPDPDALLTSVQREEAAKARGRLKVFLGMCPGVGKTFAMLEAARRAQAAGRDLVIGLVETHGRKETEAVASGLAQIPRRSIEYRGVTLTELDLDAVLARKPELVLVDELAHTNAPGSRHPKRWQDVQELLDAGIDVFTTLNVQHVESRADTVHQITGAEIRETVPDRVLDHAVLELVDLPPGELLRRLEEGRVYVPDRAALAAQNFFREANLAALRELALRLVADHVGMDTRELRQARSGSSGPWKTGDRLLVAVGPGALSIHIIRWTRRMADALQCPWFAVHVERTRPLSEAAQLQLSKNLAIARELGADVLLTSDDDIVSGLLRVASEQNVTQIVFGKPSGSGWLEWLRDGQLLWRLARESGDIDVHVVRAEPPASSGKSRPQRSNDIARRLARSPFSQYATAAGIVVAACLFNLAIMDITEPSVSGLVFLLAVVLAATVVGRGPVLFAGALSALVWNFVFLPPHFTFNIERPEHGVLFVTYFVVALVLGQLVARIRQQQEAERRREERSTALYELTRDLAGAGSRDEVVWQVMAQVNRFFSAAAAIVLPADGRLAPHPDSMLVLSDKEIAVADWAFRQRKTAGRFTDNLPGADALHLPLATDRKTFGVLAVGLAEQALPLAQRELLEIFAQQAALALDRVDLRSDAEQGRLLAESERLSRVLLDSISHELRTPLAAISTAASSLVESDTASPELRRSLVAEIQEANARLNRVVGNLLDLARLEHGSIRPRLDWHDARDVVHTTLRELKRDLASHPVQIDMPSEPLLTWLDFSLIQHSLANLLVNAAMHTPAETPIDLTVRNTDDGVVIAVADRGPGIPSDLLPRVFEKFFRAPTAPAGGSGLGLAIAKGFVEAHGGTIRADDREGGGTTFTVTLPQPERPSLGEAPK
jgi:two-component system sensor histidine kinase KdpD